MFIHHESDLKLGTNAVSRANQKVLAQWMKTAEKAYSLYEFTDASNYFVTRSNINTCLFICNHVPSLY